MPTRESSDHLLVVPDNNAEMPPEKAIEWHAGKIIEISQGLYPPNSEEVSEANPAKPAHAAIMFDCLGLHEVRDKDKLMNFFEVENGLRVDPDETAWCAIFQWTAINKSGIYVPYTPNARQLFKSLVEIGQPIRKDVDELQEGDIFGWGSHIATFVGYADAEDKATSYEEWAALQDPDGKFEMVIGGNQSNMVNISPKIWYDRYSEFLGVIRLG